MKLKKKVAKQAQMNVELGYQHGHPIQTGMNEGLSKEDAWDGSGRSTHLNFQTSNAGMSLILLLGYMILRCDTLVEI